MKKDEEKDAAVAGPELGGLRGRRYVSGIWGR